MYDRSAISDWGTTGAALPGGMQIHLDRSVPVPRYAGFWRRTLASLVDTIVLMVPLLLDEFLFRSRLADLTWYVAYFMVGIIIAWLYTAGFESSSWQATPGKRALGSVVTDLAGRRVTFGRATGRFFAHYVSTLTLGGGYLIQPFTDRRQALHDLLAGTLVVRS